MSLKQYDKITVADLVRVHRAVVASTSWQKNPNSLRDYGFFRVSGASANAGSHDYPMAYHNEGITWIHGHHADDSAEVRAMLSAQALIAA